jgi:cobalt-zinc-cadmium resistance protein CzcA
MAHTVVSALVGALIFSFTLVPVLVWMALRTSRKPLPDSPILRVLRRAYDPTLRLAFENPGPVIGVAICALVAALVLLPKLGSEFLPELNEGSLYVTFALPGNISLTEGRRLVPAIRERLRRTHEVADVLSQLGRPEDGTDPTLPNNLEVFLKLRPLDEWRPGAHSPYDLVPEMENNLQEIPGLEYNFSQPIRDNVNENIAGQFGQIALKIYGDDLNTLQQAAATAADTIAKVPGASDVASSSRARCRSCRWCSTARHSRGTTSTSRTCRTTSRPRWQATPRPTSSRASGASTSPSACRRRRARTPAPSATWCCRCARVY